jgi:hypothetical protein
MPWRSEMVYISSSGIPGPPGNPGLGLLGSRENLGPGCTKPYKFMGFGAMDVTKPYKFIGFGTMDVPNTDVT